MRVRHAILRPIAAVAVAVASVVAFGLTAPAGASWPPYTTTIVTPTNYDVVTGDVLVTVASTAPMVMFIQPGEPLWGGTRVPVVSGSASFVWSTDGFVNEAGVSVANCDDLGDCTAPPVAYVTVVVHNDRPALTAPTEGAIVGSSTTLTATLPDASPTGGVKFFVAGHDVGFDGTAPFEFTVANMTEGPTDAYAEMCNVSGTICTGQIGGYASFTVQVLHPSISSVAPTPMSPNGDGRADTTKVTYSLANPQAVSYSIIRWPSHSLVRGPISLGIPSAGTHSLVWNGTDASGHRVSDGWYAIQLDTYRHLDGGELATGTATDFIFTDTAATALTKLTGSGASFAPKPDGYLDTWMPSITVYEPATVFLDIANSHGALLRRLSVFHGMSGYVPIIWNGRAADGKIVSAGTYSFRFWAQDVAGNRSFTGYYPVHVSGQ